jgi:hypothetical protein
MHWGVVVCLDEFPSPIYISCDNDLVSLVPCAIETLELMWIDPRLETCFILLMLMGDCHDGLCKHMIRQYCDIGVVLCALIVVWPSRQCICSTIGFPLI